MKLFVDDLRECPEGWTLARTITEAIRLIATQQPEEISLDHDIGCRLVSGQEHSSNETFEPVARFLCYYRYLPSPRIIFHTANIQAAIKMAGIIGRRYDSSQMYNPENYK